jgi:hypothetical protein
MMVMDYCGVEFTAVESPEGSSWKWQLSILDKDRMKTSGEAANRSTAIEQAHEAIGEGLRANAAPDNEPPPRPLRRAADLAPREGYAGHRRRVAATPKPLPVQR